jgi:hypothetical protein
LRIQDIAIRFSCQDPYVKQDQKLDLINPEPDVTILAKLEKEKRKRKEKKTKLLKVSYGTGTKSYATQPHHYNQM